jgi:chromosome partitioning protein
MEADGGGARVIALLNQKGGVGKTTSVVNLGAAIAEAGRRVCLIDLDPQAHLTLHLGLEPDQLSRTVYDLFVEPDVQATDVLVAASDRLDVVPAEVDLAAVEVELAHHPQRQGILAAKCAAIAADYDCVLIDCPPSLGLLTLNALTMAREVIVPMQAHFLALQGVSKLLETVGLVCRSVNPGLAVTGVLLCMHEGQTTLAREVVADLEGFFESSREQKVPWRTCRVLQPAIRRNIKLAEAPSFGKTIFDYEPWCPGAIDYRLLARRIMAHWELDGAVVAESTPVTQAVEPKRVEPKQVEPKPPAPEVVSGLNEDQPPRQSVQAPLAEGGEHADAAQQARVADCDEPPALTAAERHNGECV